ncbi:MAG: YggU family protein [Candidatus Latescibacteria bacterium]|nr:YggU family protein [Candidatus Latescibacterota bacterium]
MLLSIRLTPNASKDEIVGRSADGLLRVKVQSPPVDGAANKRLISFIAGRAGVSKSKVRIVGGNKSRNKTLEITGDEHLILQKLEEGI